MENTERRQLCTVSLTGNQPCGHFDFEFPRLQKCKKINFLSQPPSLWHFVTATLADKYTSHIFSWWRSQGSTENTHQILSILCPKPSSDSYVHPSRSQCCWRPTLSCGICSHRSLSPSVASLPTMLNLLPVFGPYRARSQLRDSVLVLPSDWKLFPKCLHSHYLQVNPQKTPYSTRVRLQPALHLHPLLSAPSISGPLFLLYLINPLMNPKKKGLFLSSFYR